MASDRDRLFICSMFSPVSSVCSVLKTTVILLICSSIFVDSLHIQGSWHSRDFFKFLAKFGFQKTNEHDKLNTQGYIYGNITTKDNFTTDITFVVVDSEYFLQYYGNRSVQPRTEACPSMFGKINNIAWDYPCNTAGREDFLRKVPCPHGKLCVDEETTPERVVPGHQFTYAVQDINQPRYDYVSPGTSVSTKMCMHASSQIHGERKHFLIPSVDHGFQEKGLFSE